MPQRTYKTQAIAHNIFIARYLTISDGVKQLRALSKGFRISVQIQNSKALSALLPDSWQTTLVHSSCTSNKRTWIHGCIFFPLNELLHCPLPQTPVYSISSFGCTDSCTGIPLHWCSAVSTSSDDCPWPLRNSINPAQSFCQCECIVSHVCYSWHAEQQGLLASN